jgi:uncharacterized membrane-anchored protein YjiN (DUF445 family)
MRRNVSVLFALIFLMACRVTMITGYDQVLDQTINEMKKDFNKHFIKLSRALQDDDPNNQKFERYQDYYDELEADLVTIRDRTKFLGGSSAIVKRQVSNVDSVFREFINMHRAGLPDRPGDDRHDIRDGINSALDAVTVLQESLKTTGKAN